MPEGPGARIAADGAGQGLGLAIVPGPDPEDRVVEGEGAKVYLAQHAAQVLANTTLDVAQDTPRGDEPKLRFTIVPQATN